jgi:hypothetical protein
VKVGDIAVSVHVWCALEAGWWKWLLRSSWLGWNACKRALCYMLFWLEVLLVVSGPRTTFVL